MTAIYDYIDGCAEAIDRIVDCTNKPMGVFIFELRLRIEELELYDDLVKDLYDVMTEDDELRKDYCIDCLKLLKKLYNLSTAYTMDMATNVPESLIYAVRKTYESDAFAAIMKL
jgi:hypothetical protein